MPATSGSIGVCVTVCFMQSSPLPRALAGVIVAVPSQVTATARTSSSALAVASYYSAVTPEGRDA